MSATLENLADLLADMLTRPIRMPPEAAHFAAATMGAQDDGAISDLLADPDDPDGRILLEYLLFPGQDTKLQLESALLAARPNPDQTDTLADLIAARVPWVVFQLPDGDEVRVRLDTDAARTYTQRLRPAARMPDQLVDVIRTTFDTPFSVQTLVLLRHARFERSLPAIRFLVRLVQNSAASDAFLADFELACLFLGHANHADLLGAMRERYETCRRLIKAHDRFQESFATSNFEIQRMQGGMPAHVDADALRAEMRFLSRACLGVFDEPVTAPGAPSDRDLGDFDGADGAQRLIDMLDD